MEKQAQPRESTSAPDTRKALGIYAAEKDLAWIYNSKKDLRANWSSFAKALARHNGFTNASLAKKMVEEFNEKYPKLKKPRIDEAFVSNLRNGHIRSSHSGEPVREDPRYKIFMEIFELPDECYVLLQQLQNQRLNKKELDVREAKSVKEGTEKLRLEILKALLDETRFKDVMAEANQILDKIDESAPNSSPDLYLELVSGLSTAEQIGEARMKILKAVQKSTR